MAAPDWGAHTMQRNRRTIRGLYLLLLSAASIALTNSAAAQQPSLEVRKAYQADLEVRKEYPPCARNELESTLRFSSEPGNIEQVVLDRRNVSDRACTLPDFYVNLAFTSVSQYRQTRASAVVASPGQTGEQTFRWHTTPADANTQCTKPGWIASPITAIVPSLMGQICSEITVSPWSLAKDPVDATASFGANREPEAPAFRLTAKRRAYDDGEQISLHVALDPSSDWSPQADGTCPTVFLEVDSPEHAVRVDETQPLSYIGCGENSARQKTGDWQTGFDLDSGIDSRWRGLGEHTFQVFAIAGGSDSGKTQFVASNVVHLQILDPTKITRDWGPLTAGLHASVALDKDTYRVGEDVPLHIAIQNLSANLPVYSIDPSWDACSAVGVEVRGSLGQPQPAEARLPQTGSCGGFGFGLQPFGKGRMATLERELGIMGWMPKDPGDYTVVVTWNPCITADTGKTGLMLATDPKSCIKVQAIAPIRIIPADAK